MRSHSSLSLSVPVVLALAACAPEPTADEASTSGSSTSGDGDGDPSTGESDGAPGDGDGAPGDGDGDGAPGDGDGDPSNLTYWKDAKAILDASCVTCHVDGGIGPFALETWAQVEQWAPIIRPSIDDRSMPPWPPNPSCNSYQHERSLSDHDRQVLLGWIDIGYPEGDPADAPPDPEPPPPFEADVTISLAEPFVPTQSPDDYRCFIVPWPEELTETTYIQGQLVVPDQKQIVHHVVLYAADPGEAAFFQALDDADPGPGYTCFGGPGTYDWTARWIGDWVPGIDAWRAPAGTGIAMAPGSIVIVQMHYNTIAAPAVGDQSIIQFDITDTVEREGTFTPVTKFEWVFGWEPMTIPAGEPEVHHGVTLPRDATIFQYTLGAIGIGPNEELDVWRSALHMHLLGTRARMSILRDGGEDCLLQIDDWDFNWQGDYLLNTPLSFGPGDELQLDCWYDNSEANQPIIDGQPKVPATVGWGEGTLDEMCLGVVYVARK
jgi:hypothetical protein